MSGIMDKSLKNLLDYKISAIDGEIGKVKGFYFDNGTLTVRYLIVETGSLFFGRNVMISTQALINADWEKDHFLTNMTIQQIEDSPKVEDGKHPTLTQEIQLHLYYKWLPYWDVSVQSVSEQSSSHLFNSSEILDSSLIANDGEVGTIKDFLVDEKDWKINFIVVDAFISKPAKEIILSSKWITKFDPASHSVFSDRSINKIKNNPVYNPEKVSI
jgi:hypothetical protein